MDGRMRVQISPSLLAADTAHLGAAAAAAQAGGADSLHIDVMDGHYVANLAFSPKNVSDLRAVTQLPLHVHLEVSNPDACIPLFRDADLIIVQEDTTADLGATIRLIRGQGMAVGVGVNPDRPIERLAAHLGDVDLVVVMAVWPGFGGQPFDASVLAKAAWAQQRRSEAGLRYGIGLDGGVSRVTAALAAAAGVEVLIAGSAIFDGVRGEGEAGLIAERVLRLREAAGM